VCEIKECKTKPDYGSRWNLFGTCMKCGLKITVLHETSRYGNRVCGTCGGAWYENNCIMCKGPIDSRYPDTRKRCTTCNWFVCPQCSGCFCTAQERLYPDKLAEMLRKYGDPSLVIIDDDLTNPYGDGCCSFCGMEVDGIIHPNDYCPNEPDH
jgi:hypothetical protein